MHCLIGPSTSESLRASQALPTLRSGRACCADQNLAEQVQKVPDEARRDFRGNAEGGSEALAPGRESERPLH